MLELLFFILMFFVNMVCFFVQLQSAMYLSSLFSLGFAGFALYFAVKAFVEYHING